MASTFRRLATLSIGAAALVATSACAVYAEQRRPLPRGQVYGAERAQLDRGYRDGVRAGERDLRSRDRFDYRDERAWQRAGSRAYREGFERGYAAGYRRTDGRYGNDDRYSRDTRGGYGAGYGNVATQTGFRDGYEQGLEDARDGDRHDPVRARRYRSADHDYDRRYGDRERWKIDYRQGFLAGYERGYREGR